VLHPSAIKLNTPGEIGKSPREYTHTHMGVHGDFIKETGRRNGKKKSVTLPVVFPMKWYAVYLHKNLKN
jgi:hypothetical protein